MGDNGEIKKEEQKPINEKVVMVIEMSPDGKMMVHFPLLNDKVATYGFLKMAEKTLDRHYAQIEQTKIIKPKGIMDFVRGGRN